MLWVLLVLLVLAGALVGWRVRERRLPVSRLSERARRRRSRVHVSEIPDLATQLGARDPGRAARDLARREALMVRLGEAWVADVRERVGAAWDAVAASPPSADLEAASEDRVRAVLLDDVDVVVEDLDHPVWDVVLAAEQLNVPDEDLAALAAREAVLVVAPVLLAGAWRHAPHESLPEVGQALERVTDALDQRVQGDLRRVWSARRRPLEPDPDAVLLVELGDAIVAAAADPEDGTTPLERREDGRSVVASFALVLAVVDSWGAPADRRAAYAVASLVQTVLVTWLLGAGLDAERSVMLAAVSEDLVDRLRDRGLADELSLAHVERCARLVYRSAGLLELAATPLDERT